MLAGAARRFLGGQVTDAALEGEMARAGLPPERTVLVQGLAEGAGAGAALRSRVQYPHCRAARVKAAAPGSAFVELEAFRAPPFLMPSALRDTDVSCKVLALIHGQSGRALPRLGPSDAAGTMGRREGAPEAVRQAVGGGCQSVGAVTSDGSNLCATQGVGVGGGGGVVNCDMSQKIQ